ncbi:MAG: hypothetical protein IKA41_05700, partial [Bacteroidaceae bacterium]|nr:hypothetical protein [Bacteroidaceae bacterium]
ACTLMLIVACNDDTTFTGEGETVPVTFHPTMVGTRTIGDAANIDKLTVVAYDENNSEKIRLEKSWSDAQSGVTLTLIEGRTYSILFWAHSEACNAYTIGEGGKISVDYSNYKDGGFAKMEQMDAFYATAEITVSVANSNNNPVELTRPFAQLNFADKTTEPVKDTHKTVVTFHSIPTAFNPFDGTVETSNSETTFTFADYDILTGERLPVKNDDNTYSSYYYLSSNYIFVPANSTLKLPVTIDLQLVDGTSVNKHEFKNEKAIELLKNHKTNVAGAIVQQPETWSVWDGTTKTEPGKDAQDRYIIDEASDIAWLSANGASIAAGTFLQTKDIDMNNAAIASISLPAGSTYDGGNMQIINYKNSLFGDATNLKVQNLIVENITATGTTHVGALVNTLKGSSSFTNVQVTNATATTTNGAAGGVVGYVVRTSEKDRNETLDVSFSGCKLNGVTVSGSTSEGKFVGLLSGYDNNETLSFDANCEAESTSVADYQSVYTTANNSVWAGNVANNYDGWLGHETYRRAKVTFNGERLAPKWDGTTKIAPIVDNNVKLIFSPFDLANLQGGGHTAVTFKENVDLGGDGANKNLFTPISYINTLDGEGNKLYNLNIFYKNWVVGFTLGTNSTTVHQNLHFVNSSVRANMTGSESQVYVGTLNPYVQKAYTVKNVTVTNGYLLGLGKLGGLIAYVTSESDASLNCSDCTVEKTTIENIQGTYEDSFAGVKFNPHGEVGGLIGFIQNKADVTECKVSNCIINCYGQNDKKFLIFITVPGRHVNDFIGDIRLEGGQRVNLIGNTVEGNSFTNRKKDTHSSKCPIVGKCYKISGTAGTVYIGT